LQPVRVRLSLIEGLRVALSILYCHEDNVVDQDRTENKVLRICVVGAYGRAVWVPPLESWHGLLAFAICRAFSLRELLDVLQWLQYSCRRSCSLSQALPSRLRCCSGMLLQCRWLGLPHRLVRWCLSLVFNNRVFFRRHTTDKCLS
jgi:hypothetical protein